MGQEETSNIKKPMHLIVFPYWCQSELDRFEKLAELWPEISNKATNVQFLFLARWDVTPNIKTPLKFSSHGTVRTHKCKKPKFSKRGRPSRHDNAKHMFHQCMKFVEQNYNDDGGFVFWMEYDVVFVKTDWLENLEKEWMAKRDKPTLLMGHLVTKANINANNRHDFVEHINGVACYSKSLSKYVDFTESLKHGYSFDVYLSMQLKKLNLWQQVIASSAWDHRLDYECNSVRMNEFSPETEISIIHGCKTDWSFNKFIECVGQNKLGKYFIKYGVSKETDENTHWLEFIKNQKCKKFKVHVWESGGNFFFTGMAKYVRKVLTQANFKEDTECESYNKSVLDIVVAPHEFMYYDKGKSWIEERVSNAVYLNTEQWNTNWFSKSLDVITKSKKAMDINPNSTNALRSLGINAVFFPMIQLDSEKTLIDNKFSFQDRKFVEINSPKSDIEYNDREIDILYIGASNQRRDIALANLGKTLSSYNTFIHSPNLVGQPIFKDDPDAIDFKNVCKLARNSKVLLNIHRDEYPYFEWHRLFLMGISNGCVVLSEPCLKNNFLNPSTILSDINKIGSYIEAPLNELQDTIKFLLDTSKGKDLLKKIHLQAKKETQFLKDNYFKI